ncbi:transmembrane protein 79-like [Panonychus citri]|uniref:transmembrane protein 79-like n=1 Tax=Panonychus citri TaxID=50023 RepID=UPI002307CACC|nr:transmembrane protein 79-like [Panonychus citri]XP_053201648.1 transmembrane protein 79-like [Panonychus citri]
MAVTRNQSKGDSVTSTPMKSPSPSSSYSGRKSVRSRIDPTTNLTFGSIVTIGIVASIILQVSLAYLVMNDKIKLNGKTTVQSLMTLGNRLEYILRFQAIHVVWLVITTALVVFSRLSTGAVNPLEGFENLVISAKQVHTNSMEQFLLIFVNQLILATNLAPDIFIRVIPLLNILFAISRVLFWLGYPKYRTCGFFSGMTPITLTTIYNAYALINFLF